MKGARARPEDHVRWIYAAHLAIALALLILAAIPASTGEAASFEIPLFRVLNGLPGFIYPAVWVIMQLGNIVAAPVAALVALAARRFRLAAGFLLVGATKLMVTRIVKDFVVRGRPAELIDEVIRRDAPAQGQAFVSGHAVVAVALAFVVHPYLGKWGRVVAWTLAATVCLARVYVGAHLPLDVVGGAALGWAIGAFVHLFLGAPRRGRPSREESTAVQDPHEPGHAP